MVALATHAWSDVAAGSDADGTVVLVHGVAGWHRTWWRVGPALAREGWRVVAVDLRGHGNSPPIGAPVTVRDFAEDLAASIERMGGPADAVIGHSLGAAVGAELAVARPDLVRRLVLEDPPVKSRVGDRPWLENLEREMRMANEAFEAEVARTREANPEWHAEDARQDVRGKQLADAEGIIASFRQDVGTRVLDLAPRLPVPALYLLGDENRSIVPAEARRRLQETIPTACRVAVVDAGHTVHRDRVADYVSLVLDWIGPAGSP